MTKENGILKEEEKKDRAKTETEEEKKKNREVEGEENREIRRRGDGNTFAR